MNKASLLFSAMLFFALGSCQEEADKISDSQSKAVEDHSSSEAYFNEAADLSTTAFNKPTSGEISGRTGAGKQIAITVSGDTRFNGATITLVTPDNNIPTNPQGTITIDFGTGQTDPKGTVRKGKIVIAYSGIRFLINSTLEVTFVGYEVDGVKLEGKRALRNLSTISTTGINFEVKDTGGKITFADGSSITRESTETHQWKFGATLADYQWLIDGTANGLTRENKTYQSAIKTTLVYKASCALERNIIPAQGSVLLTVDSLPITIDFGSGTCDNNLTLSVAGFSKEITVGQ